MLLPLNEPTTSPALRLITGIAGQILEYAARWSGPTFDKQDFHSWLEQVGFWRLLGSRSAIVQRLPTLLALSQDKRKQLRDAFYNDVRFYECLDSPDYTFHFPSLPDDVREIGEAFLRLFYDRLAGDGFHDGPTQRRRFTVTRAEVEIGYRAANDEMKLVCPACLGRLEQPAEKMSVSTVVTKRSLVDCEHFFPRSLYPPLVVHPNNLVFVCRACNSYHNNDSPLHLSPLVALEAGAIRKTFVPYKRSALAMKGTPAQQVDEVKLEFDRVNPKKPFVALVSNGTTSFARERAENFDRVYGLSKRWGDEVPEMYNILRETIRFKAALKGEVLNRETIEVYVQEEWKVDSNFRYRKERAYVRSQYTQWIQQHCLETLIIELTS